MFIFAALLILLFLSIPLIIFFVVCQWKLFTKAGVEGWKSLVPIYNLYIQLQITKDPTIWLLYFFIPIVNIYFVIKHIHHFSLAFGKNTGFTIGLILLPIVFFPILAFGNAQYIYNTEDSLLNELQAFE